MLGGHLSRPCHRLTAYLCCGAVFSLTFAGIFSNAYERYYVGSGAGGVFCAQTGTTHSLVEDTSQTYAAFTINQATQALAWAVNVTQNASSVLLPLSAVAPAAAAQGTVRASALLSPPVPVLDLSAMRLFVDAAAPLSEGAARAWRLRSLDTSKSRYPSNTACAARVPCSRNLHLRSGQCDRHQQRKLAGMLPVRPGRGGPVRQG